MLRSEGAFRVLFTNFDFEMKFDDVFEVYLETVWYDTSLLKKLDVPMAAVV